MCVSSSLIFKFFLKVSHADLQLVRSRSMSGSTSSAAPPISPDWVSTEVPGDIQNGAKV